MADDTSENDLPLVSNVNDIVINHYMFNFSCNFEERSFLCSVVLHLEPVINAQTQEINGCKCYPCNFTEKNGDNDSSSFSLNVKGNLSEENIFMLILDSHKIIVEGVEEITLAFAEKEKFKYVGYNPILFSTIGKLNFITDKWSLKIWKINNSCKFCFPKFIRISYKTVPEGPSLLWVTDQDKNPSVFTYGAWVNNRSLFPCQEPPTAMATWEATVSVNNSAVVLMSGDEDAWIKTEAGKTSYYYFTKNVLPLSTLCLAVGFWEEHRISSRYEFGPKCRIFSPASLMDKSVQELFEYVPYCLLISEDTFGPYPFPRIDFLVVPPTFGSLGMASPNIVFLSQSLLTGDSSMSSRIAHEIAHGWFGLLIGASDWTEEWLSEGFATFVEDYFHVRTVNMSEAESEDYIEVKTYIRLRTLLQEISNTNEDLQVLRSSKGETVVETVDGVSAAVLRNGQNPIKAFIQVHYIKGYFLLKHLANLSCIDKFMTFLERYIFKYRGRLVTSKDFLTEYFDWFPEMRSQLSMQDVYDNWLHNPGIAEELKNLKPSSSNQIFVKAMKEIKKWQQQNFSYLKRKSKKKKFCVDHFDILSSEQQILLLETILDEPALSQHTLKDLDDFFTFSVSNAEVQHRWFEIVVKYKYKKCYEDLRKFLTDHLAMGVYLFGEMIFSDDFRLRKMAEETYTAVKHEMEPNYVSTIDQMLQDVK